MVNYIQTYVQYIQYIHCNFFGWFRYRGKLYPVTDSQREKRLAGRWQVVHVVLVILIILQLIEIRVNREITVEVKNSIR